MPYFIGRIDLTTWHLMLGSCGLLLASLCAVIGELPFANRDISRRDRLANIALLFALSVLVLPASLWISRLVLAPALMPLGDSLGWVMFVMYCGLAAIVALYYVTVLWAARFLSRRSTLHGHWYLACLSISFALVAMVLAHDHVTRTDTIRSEFSGIVSRKELGGWRIVGGAVGADAGDSQISALRLQLIEPSPAERRVIVEIQRVPGEPAAIKSQLSPQDVILPKIDWIDVIRDGAWQFAFDHDSVRVQWDPADSVRVVGPRAELATRATSFLLPGDPIDPINSPFAAMAAARVGPFLIVQFRGFAIIYCLNEGWAVDLPRLHR